MGHLSVVFMVIFIPWVSLGLTDPQDVSAMNALYAALGNPPLVGWVPNGGDPCLEAWQGIECVYSNITSINLNGVNLGGELGTQLDLFASIIKIDLSDNHIGGGIPGNLPSTMRYFFLSSNLLTGPIPTLASMTQLTDMSINNNSLTGEIPDDFLALSGLVNLDLSSNNLSGQLPPSMQNLSSLTFLHLQNNQLIGTLDVLQELPLRDLNVENNLFSGPIPAKLFAIPNFRKDGNPFNTTISPSSAPPPFDSEGPTSGAAPEDPKIGPISQEGSSSPRTKSSSTKKIVGIAVVVVLLVIIILFAVLLTRHCKKKQKPDRFSQNHKMDVSKTPKERSKFATEDLVRPKGERGMDARRMGGISNSKSKEEVDMNRMAVLPEQKEHEIDMTGIDITLMPPPFEKPIANPVVPAEIAMMKLKSKGVNIPSSVKTFTVASLQQYTNSFTEENCIGEGMFGSVYRAELPDGKLLAVKKLDNMACMLQNDMEFLDFVSSMSKLQHVNAVKLEGFCAEHGQRLLIFEYYSNGTLHDALHSDGLTKNLTWNTRVRMALGAARALEYLHEVCHPPIVHQNFKSANLLLDDEFAVHVSDCGFSPLISANSANQLFGEHLSANGYGAPEFETGTYTYQSDVYSFGVVMLELLTGRKAYDRSRPRGEQFLVRWAIPQLHDIDSLSRMVDPSLNGAYPAKSLSRFADIISLCVQSEPEFRPPMSEIVQSLLHMIQREPPSKR